MRRILSLLTATIAISACSATSTSKWSAPLPPDADPAVAAVIPKGTYTVTGGMNMLPEGGFMYELAGFVDFGTEPDGRECEAAYTTAVARRFSATAEDGAVLATRGVRTAGETERYAVTSERGKDINEKGLEWRDAEDPSAGYLPMLFYPSVIASDGSSGVLEGAGNGLLCSIGVIPRFMQIDGDRLVFDAERVEAVMAAKNGRHVAQLLGTLEVSGSRHDRIAESLTELYGIGLDPGMGDPYLTLSNTTDGGFEIVQFYLGKPIVTLTFAPAEDRVVPAPDGPTYFERLAEKAKRGDREALLREAIQERAGLVSLGDEESSDDAAEPAWLTDLLR